MLFQISLLSIFTYSYVLCSRFKPYEHKKVQKEALPYHAKESSYMEIYKKEKKLRESVKFVLLWSDNTLHPFPNFEDKQKAFIRNNCPYINCYVTDNRNFFGGDLKRFNAIIFNGRVLKTSVNDLPEKRYKHQKYIFLMTQSPAYYPICNPTYDNFFNWTYTYRLDSDLLHPYFQIKDMNDNIVGPKPDVEWKYSAKVDYEMESIWRKKNKAAAWMVTTCGPKNRRTQLANKIFQQLQKANLTLDVFSPCNLTFRTLDFPEGNIWDLIQNEYYFYLSFENSSSIDYVTDKVLNTLHHYTIPIVFGGANYTSFLPPLSYLDMSKLTVESLVSKMITIMSSKQLFKDYFRWRSSYKYVNADQSNVCALCSALHNQEMMRTDQSYKFFRKWWNKNMTECRSETLEDFKHKIINSLKNVPNENTLEASQFEHIFGGSFKNNKAELPYKITIDELSHKNTFEESLKHDTIEESPKPNIIKATPTHDTIEESPNQNTIEESPKQNTIEEIPYENILEEVPYKKTNYYEYTKLKKTKDQRNSLKGRPISIAEELPVENEYTQMLSSGFNVCAEKASVVNKMTCKFSSMMHGLVHSLYYRR